MRIRHSTAIPEPEESGIHPSQFLAGRATTPERRLMAAILDTAVYDYRRYAHTQSPHGRALFENVRTWFFTDDPTWPFSFRSICEEFDLGMDWMRRELVHSVPSPPAAAA